MRAPDSLVRHALALPDDFVGCHAAVRAPDCEALGGLGDHWIQPLPRLLMLPLADLVPVDCRTTEQTWLAAHPAAAGHSAHQSLPHDGARISPPTPERPPAPSTNLANIAITDRGDCLRP